VVFQKFNSNLEDLEDLQQKTPKCFVKGATNLIEKLNIVKVLDSMMEGLLIFETLVNHYNYLCKFRAGERTALLVGKIVRKTR